jgi:hypothetical protein
LALLWGIDDETPPSPNLALIFAPNPLRNLYHSQVVVEGCQSSGAQRTAQGGVRAPSDMVNRHAPKTSHGALPRAEYSSATIAMLPESEAILGHFFQCPASQKIWPL